MNSKIIVALESMTVNLDLIDAAARRRGHHLVVLAGDPSMYLPDGEEVDLRQCDTSDEEAVRKELESFGDSLIALLSPTDTWGIQAVALCEERGFPHLMSSQKLEQLRDKQWVREVTSQALGLEEDQAEDTPHILKPRRGTGSQGVELYNSRGEAEEAISRQGLDASQWVIEPYLLGPVMSAETYTRRGQTLLFGVTNRIISQAPFFVELVKTFPHLHDTAWESDVERFAQRVLESVGFEDGFAHIEFVQTRRGFELIELNARMPGALIGPAIAQTSGVDIYDLLIADALGEEPGKLVRKISGGHSHVSIYAKNTGVLSEINGVKSLALFPGDVGWLPAKELGARIKRVGDYTSRIGNVFATAPEPALAQDYAIAASRSISVTVTEE